MKGKINFFILAVATLFIWIPLWMLLTGSFMGNSEVTSSIGTVINNGEKMVNWKVFPQYPTLRPYVELLLDSPGFFIMFWNSCKQVFFSLIGQLIVAVPAAWSFARFNYRGKKVLFVIYIILMIMPFQVTMVSSYLVLDKFHMMNTHLAIIVPNMFSAFPVFVMTKFFNGIPKSLIEAAKLDGAREIDIFLRIGIPMGASGILSAVVLGFLEYWNALEQPLTFLREKSLWPLSLYLPNVSVERMGVSLVASVIMMAPALLIFLYGQRYLEQGIVASGIKD